jgi:hypothetical protein
MNKDTERHYDLHFQTRGLNNRNQISVPTF